MTGHCHGLSLEETKDLWVQADIDGNGILDYAEFQVNYLHQLFLITITLLYTTKILVKLHVDFKHHH